MEKISVMRWLRIKHQITLREMAKAAGVPHQELSDIELGKCRQGKKDEALTQQAFETVIVARHGAVRCLAEEYNASRSRLFELITMEEVDHGV